MFCLEHFSLKCIIQKGIYHRAIPLMQKIGILVTK